MDAPCSGIGLIRRKPDIKYNKDLQDFESLKAVQLDILSSVCQTLRKGGIITYSTCTIIAEENQEVIQAFLESHPDFEQVALDHPCKDIVVNGCLAITPEQYLTDGFFIAQLRKKAYGYRGGNADASQKENYGNIIINGHWPKTVK